MSFVGSSAADGTELSIYGRYLAQERETEFKVWMLLIPFI